MHPAGLNSSTAATGSLPAWLLRAAALDVRALAAMRIGMALLLLWDLAVRAGDLTAHYTDAGVLPRSARMAMQWDFNEPWWMSLHMLSGSWAWQAGLFFMAAVAATMLLVGYRTKFATLGSMVLLLSLHGRFPLLTQGGDMLLRCMLFWSLFVPLDACWSVAAWRWEATQGRGKVCPNRLAQGYVVSWGTAALIAQLALMYLFTALLKTAPSWRTDFSAAYYALSIDHFTSNLGYRVLRYPSLLKVLTASSLLLEACAPLLLLAPLGHTFFRTAVPLAFIGFHLGLAATMDLGTFPWICMLFWIALLPPRIWEGAQSLAARLRGRAAKKPTAGMASLQLVGSPLGNCLVMLLLTYVVLLNVKRLSHPLATVGAPPLSLVGKVTGLQQYWNMFSPGPYRFGSWLRLEGVTAQGTLVNLYQPDEPLPDVKPANVSATYPTQYWRRCLVTLYEFEEAPHQEGTLRFFTERWNASHEAAERVVTARLVHMVEPTPAPFAPAGEREPRQRRVLREVNLRES
jgi:hypothetical protein